MNILIITREKIPFEAAAERRENGEAGFNEAASGGALRIWSIGKALQEAGHEVRYSIPVELFENSEPAGHMAQPFQMNRINEVILKEAPDAVLFEQWQLASLSAEEEFLSLGSEGDSKEKPLRIVDLHGSLILENAFRGHSDRSSSMEAKLRALSSCDLILCAGERQKAYFSAWCIAAGHDPKTFQVIDVPVFIWGESLKRNPVKIEDWTQLLFDGSGNDREDESGPLFLFSGRLWPWIDPFPGLTVLAEELEAQGKGKLLIYASPPELKDSVTGEDLSSEQRGELKHLESFSRVKMMPFGPREKLLETMSKVTAAFDLYQDNPERWFAYSTRSCEFLWAGVPVIHSKKSPLAEEIQSYSAGWCLNPEDTDALRKLIRGIIDGKTDINAASRGAFKLSSSKLKPERCISELIDWLKSPKKSSPGATMLDVLIDKKTKETLNRWSDVTEENRLLRRRLALMRSHMAEAERKLNAPLKAVGASIAFKALRFIYLKMKRVIFDYPSLLYLIYLHRRAFSGNALFRNRRRR